jgi:hypothetical protein
MTKEDQQSVIGRAVQELSDCRKTLACREHQLHEAGQRFESLAQVCGGRPCAMADDHIDRVLADVPTIEGLREALVDCRKTFQRMRELRKTLADFGLDLS